MQAALSGISHGYGRGSELLGDGSGEFQTQEMLATAKREAREKGRHLVCSRSLTDRTADGTEQPSRCHVGSEHRTHQEQAGQTLQEYLLSIK